MSRFSLRRIIPLLILITLVIPAEAASTGLYLDFPSWFQPADTAVMAVTVSYTELQRRVDDASATGLSVRRRMGDRTSVDIGILYPVIRKSADFRHGFSDASVSVVTRMRGDTLNASGIFLRADIRMPIASGALYPFGFRSADGGVYPAIGGGIELRRELSDLKLRGSATYTAAGQKETSGYPQNRDYLMLSAFAGVGIGSRTSISFSIFSILFTGGGYRESYLVTVRRELAGQLDLLLTGGVESGDSEDRLYDSLVSIAFSFRLPGGRTSAADGREKRPAGKEPSILPGPGDPKPRNGTD